MANQELELAFNANTTTRKYERWTEISCNKGLFSVSAPTLEEARNEAMRYFFQYYSDSEYFNDETHVFVVVKDGVKVISDHAEYMALSVHEEMLDPISIESVIKKRFSPIDISREVSLMQSFLEQVVHFALVPVYSNDHREFLENEIDVALSVLGKAIKKTEEKEGGEES